MRILVTGAEGMLGSDLVAECRKRGREAVGVDIGSLDITDPMQVAEIGAEGFGKLDWVVNCAAYTAVDQAESETDAAIMVNAIAPGYLARMCAMGGVRLAHISTDFVFDGEAHEPYKEDSQTNPQGMYGKSKRMGEEAVLAASGNPVIVRTAWLYGPNGKSFPKTIIEAWKAGKHLRVVNDQTGTPTYTADLARALMDLVEANPDAGIYHAAGPEIVTWHEFAEVAVKAYALRAGNSNPIQIDAIRTDEWPTPAKRPRYSALSFEKAAALGIAPLRPLGEAMAEFVDRLYFHG